MTTKQTKLVEIKKGKEVTKAEELAKSQREISISEFFAKNRHLLGFDNPRKALLTTVKEGVDNSLTYDMPLVIRHKGKISIVSIGDFVDKQIECNKDRINLMRNGDLERLPLDENVEVLAFDKETLKLSFRKVSTAFRHRVNSKIFRVTLTSGRYVDLTAYHSVFTLNKGELTSIPTSEIGVGTPVVVPRNNWGCSYEVNELNLVEELLLLDHSLTSKINVYGINNILTDGVIKDIKRLLPKGKQYRVGDFRRFNYLPINILRGLKVDINKFSDSKIGISMGEYRIPAVIKLDHNFAELLGFYVSEGSMLSSLRRLHFSFGSHEMELVCYLKDLFEKVFRFSPKIKKAHKTAYNIIADSTVLCFVFKYVLNPGKLANTKRIPDLVFNFSKTLKHSFLLAYLAGDGYPSKELFHILKNDSNLSDLSIEKVTAATASFDLYVGLQYLLSSLGINYSVGSTNPQQRIVNHNKASFGKQFYIYVYTKGRDSPLNRLPQEGILALTTDSRVKYAVSNGIQSNISFNVLNKGLASRTMMCYYGALAILNGDLGVLRVKSVEEIDYKYEWVYDVSVPDCENFVAGVGAIMCHNSLDACEEASILPEIYVNIKQHSEDRFTVILEDNGPGIVKEQIPKVFAKLLYGSKFHAMKQSLTADEPILIKKLGKVEVVPIGSFIDPILGGNDEIKDISKLGIKVPAFDPKTNKYSMQKITHIIRHNRLNEIIKVKTEYNKEIKVTGCHSLFSYNPLSQAIESIEARELKPGSYIIVPKKLPEIDDIKEVNILEYLCYNDIKGNWAYVYGIKDLVERIKRNAKVIHKKVDKSRKFYRINCNNTSVDIVEESLNYYLNKGFLPLQIIYNLGLQKDVSRGRIITYRHGKVYKMPVVVPIDQMLMRFLGLYVAEGHSDVRQLGLTFGKHEDILINEVLGFAKVFGLNFSVETRDRSIRLKLFNSIFVKFISNICGEGAFNKRVPEFVFRTNKDLRWYFIEGYFQGDGHKVKGRNCLMASTKSKRLASELQYLFLMNGVTSSYYSQMDKGLGRKESMTHTIVIYGDSLNKSHIYSSNSIKHGEKLLEQNSARLLSITQQMIDLGDLALVKVKSIEIIKEGYEFVYDVSVPGSENFVGGTGGIACHNSRGQQGIGISAAAMYGQLTTGKPTKIISRISEKRPAQYYELHIDTRRNEPEIVKEEQVEWNKPHGTRVEIELEAKYLKGKQSVDDYLKQTAIVNPHASIIYFTPENEMIEFPRVSEELPKESKSIKPHPYGVELGVLMKMMQDTKAHTLQSFLMQDFSRVSAKVAKDICGKANLPENAKPPRIARQESEKLFKAINETKIMAPPTDCISPIGEELIIKGLKKEINAEFYAAVTRSPSVYRGNPFQLECCTGDSKIYLENGKIVSIKDYVENRMLDQKVFSMDDTLKIVPNKVLMVHKFKNKHRILKITTRTGRELKLTANNEIPIIENGKVIWKRVDQASAGEFVAVPRIIKVCGKVPHLLDILNPRDTKIVDSTLVGPIIGKLKVKYGNYKNAALKLGVKYDTFKAYKRERRANRPSLLIFKDMINDLGFDFEELKHKIEFIRIVDTKFTNPDIIRLPEVNEDLLYVLGLLNSDGYISRKGVTFVNLDENLHKVYKEKIKSLFGLEVKKYKKTESYLCNKTLYIVLKQVEKLISELPDNLIVAWLKGYVDGDGWVTLRDNKIKAIGIATAEEEKARFVQALLLRVGIISKIEKKKIQKTSGKIGGREVKTKKVKYDMVISDFSNIKKFYSLISFRQAKRANVLSKGIKNEVEMRASRDVVPLGGILHRFREENNLFQYEVGFSDQTIRQVEKNNCYMTRMNLQKIVSSREYWGYITKQLRLLAFSDVLWDKIVDIEVVPNEEYVYDLTVETGNFVANNIVMHNCGIAYGGDIPQDDLVRVMRFANRVPLLYQQSACASFKSIVGTAWKNYGLGQSRGALPQGPAIILVHIASVWVPFTSESKEAIAHYPEIIKEMKLALQECGRKLASHIRHTVKAKEQKEKIDLFVKYIPEVASALHNLCGEPKDSIIEGLNKILKKGLPNLEKNGGKIEEDKS